MPAAFRHSVELRLPGAQGDRSLRGAPALDEVAANHEAPTARRLPRADTAAPVGVGIHIDLVGGLEGNSNTSLRWLPK